MQPGLRVGRRKGRRRKEDGVGERGQEEREEEDGRRTREGRGEGMSYMFQIQIKKGVV